jgi:hypothetical protein
MLVINCIRCRSLCLHYQLYYLLLTPHLTFINTMLLASTRTEEQGIRHFMRLYIAGKGMALAANMPRIYKWLVESAPAA